MLILTYTFISCYLLMYVYRIHMEEVLSMVLPML